MPSTNAFAPAFQIPLQVHVLPSRMATGQLDGQRYAIAAANPGGTVSIHWASDPSKPQIVRVNREVTSIAIGKIGSLKHDVLFVGTPTNLIAYDLHNNRDVFFKDIADGVNFVALGTPSNNNTKLAIVGGNCSVQGFDESGEERFWTVTSDNVTCLISCDFEGEDSQRVIVGSEDCQLRVYKNEQVIWEKSEASPITNLCQLRSNVFAYSLSDGTIGVYELETRLWNFKCSNHVVAITAFDYDNDGTPELIVGFSDGTIEVRLMRYGTVIETSNVGGQIAAIATGEFRYPNVKELLVCLTDGSLKGYAALEIKQASIMNPGRSASDEATIAKLTSKIAELQRELNGYDSNLAAMQKQTSGMGRIPADTKITCALGPNLTKTGLELRMNTSNETLIKVVVVDMDNVMEGGTVVKFSTSPSTSIAVPLKLNQYVTCQLKIQVIVGYKGSNNDHVFELSHRLPRFASFVYCKARDLPPINSSVTMPLKERLSRVILWLNQSFLFDFANRNDSESLSVGFRCMQTETLLNISVQNDGSGQLELQTENMQLAGDIIQDLFSFLAIEHCDSVACFPDEFARLEQLVKNLDEYTMLKKRLNYDIADLSNLVKVLIVKGEGARLLRDMKEAKVQYSELLVSNEELIRELNKREANHKLLLDILKQINLMIQRGARLRMGRQKLGIIAACRDAIKNGSPGSLPDIIKLGHE